MSRREFEASSLSEYYTLDLSYCHHGKRLNSSMLYEIFGGYSGQDSDTVRKLMLNEATCSRSHLDYYERAGFICLQMKNTNFNDWLQHQAKSTARGDEISVYILCHLFMQHAMIHTRNKAWCSILPTGGNINYAMACDTHLLCMGNNIFGVMIPKPALTSIVSNVPSVAQAVSQPPVTLPPLDVRTMVLNIPTHPTPTPLFNRALRSTPSTSLGAPPPAKPGTSNATIGNNNNENINSDNISADQDEDTNKDDDSVSTVSTLILQDKPVSVTKVKDADVLNKECKVSLTRMSMKDLEKYLKPDKHSQTLSSDMFDSTDDVPLSQLVSIATINSDASAYQGDRGRPRHRKKRVKYEESSFESKSDSDYNPCPPKPSKITPGSGPSKDRLRVHSFMKNKGKLHTPKTTLPPIVPN